MDTAPVTRRLRGLLVLALGASLLAGPPPALGQPDDSVSLPLGRAPEGRLPLVGTPWRLEGYRHRDSERVPGPEVAAWMTLGADGLRASGGCTLFRGRYGRTGAAIDIRLRGLKRNDCAEQTTMVQLAMVDGLRQASSFEIIGGSEYTDDKLVLRDADGVELLRFGLDDVGALEMADWRLSSYTAEGRTILAAGEPQAVVSFRPDRASAARRSASGQLTGSTGCNGVVAEFSRSADVLSVGQLDRTDAPCTPELAAQEAAMVRVLEASSQMLSLPPDRLVLTSSDTGERLDFVSQRPLEGSTWLLAGGPGIGDPGGEVTLRLSDGVAVGEGPCGAYRGRYATDGVFVTFAGLEGAADDTCDERKSERALLDGLRRAVRLDRDQPGLRLLSAFDEPTLRFSSPAGP